jgi:TolB-like protein/DNA-binding winged helix-turn-helix (wHTH) protein/tetratricopeptide (TPR) repeat protein
MEHSPTRPQRVQFGPFELDLQAGELRKNGVRIRLQEQPFRLLSILMERPGQVVTLEEFRRLLWPADTFVDFDHSLNKAINKLREALGDSADHPSFIETLPKRGYRLIFSQAREAVVAPEEISDLHPEKELSSRSLPGHINKEVEPDPGIAIAPTARIPVRWMAWAAAVVVIVGALALIPRWKKRPPEVASPAPVSSLAVIPLLNLSGDPSQEYFSDGLTDALITDLAQLGSIKVISRTSSMHYKASPKTLPEIARELNVEAIVEGTVQRSGDRVRITAQLIDASSDKHIWAKSYERNVTDVFVLESEVAQDIAQHIQSSLVVHGNPAPLASTPSTGAGPANVHALETYLQGTYLLNRGSGDGDMHSAQQLFQSSIEADPNFSSAYVGLAYSNYLLLRSTAENHRARLAAAERAVLLAPGSSDAYTALGEMKLADWDWQGAERAYAQAIALNPSDAKAHSGLCSLLNVLHRLDEAASACQIAQELDPRNEHLTGVYEVRGDYRNAIASLLRDIQSHPDDGFLHYYLFRDYVLGGMQREAIGELELSTKLVGFPQVAERIHRSYAASGYSAAMREWAAVLEEFHRSNSIFLPRLVAEIYANLGDNDRAIYWLEQGFQYHDHIGGYGGLEWIPVEHMLDPLQSDPRFRDLLHRMNFPEQ